MKKIVTIIFLLVSITSFSQRDIHGKWKITRLYLGDSTRNIPGTKALRYNPATDEVSYADTAAGSSLTATYIGYGNGSNALTGTSDLIRNSSGEVILNATDKGAYKLQLEGNMYLGNASGSITATPERFFMGGTVGDAFGAPSKMKLALFTNGSVYSGVTVSQESGVRIMEYFADDATGRHDFYINGTKRLGIGTASLVFPYTGAVIDFNSDISLTHSTGQLALSGKLLVNDDAYDATTWNGSLSVPTKNAVRDKIESLSAGGVTSVSAGFGTAFTTITSTGSVKVDSFTMATRAVVYKIRDSLVSLAGNTWNGHFNGTSETSGTPISLGSFPVNINTDAGAVTYTLPLRSSNVGNALFVKNAGGGALTVQRSSSDQIYNTSAVTSEVLQPGESRMYIAATVYWYSNFAGGATATTSYTGTATGITLDATHSTVNVTATGQTITLPTAVGITGRIYTIKLTASGSGTVGTTSSQTIDGSTTYSLASQYKYVTVQSTGANWIVIANN